MKQEWLTINRYDGRFDMCWRLTQLSVSVLALLTRLSINLVFASDSLTDGLYYTRYPTYPDFCSTQEQLEQRRIVPPLVQGSFKLAHVTIVSRHGTRAPKGKHECWPSFYANNSDTAVWNCSLTIRRTTLNSPPHSPQSESSFLLLNPTYDGLQQTLVDANTKSFTTNILNGTCQVAQLLRKGFEQHLWNGRMLRETYFYRTDNFQRAIESSTKPTGAINRTILQFLSQSTDPNSFLRFRSDDEQRTLLSGQGLLVGLLTDPSPSSNEPTGTRQSFVIPTHTADKVQDILSDNDDLCARLKDLEKKAFDSKDYKKLESKYDLKKTKDWMKDNFGYALDHPLQCLMNAVCSDLSLPNALMDFGETKSNFQKLVHYELTRKNFVYSFDHAAYAKLSMGPLWVEILSHLRLALQSHTTTVANVPRLAYYSGHDSTIGQLLSSLGSKVWKETDAVPYASLLVLEVYQDFEESSKNVFRLIFNGQVRTYLIKHCHSDLCDLKILEDRLSDFATNQRDCERKGKKPNEVIVPEYVKDEVNTTLKSDQFFDGGETLKPTSLDLYDPNSWWFQVCLSTLGFGVGSYITWNHLNSANRYYF